jgi:hypothetical protein
MNRIPSPGVRSPVTFRDVLEALVFLVLMTAMFGPPGCSLLQELSNPTLVEGHTTP